MDKSIYDELSPTARELLDQAPDGWVELPRSIIRKPVRDAFATLERLGLIETRSLNTAPTATYEWRAVPGMRSGSAQARAEQKIEPDRSTADRTDSAGFHDSVARALARIGDPNERTAVLSLVITPVGSVEPASAQALAAKLVDTAEQRLRRCIRGSDMAARLGDGFAVLQANLKQADLAATLAQRLMDTLGQPYRLGEQQVEVRVSIGIAVAPRDGSEPDDLLAKAQSAAAQARSEPQSAYRFFASVEAPRGRSVA
jgi:GGDEF domain-containing protein